MSTRKESQQAMYEPRVGDVVTDTRLGRVGRVMGHEGPRWQLRPLGGGREWEADRDRMRLKSRVTIDR
ncbi:hypothetical protein [Streptomyces sp. NPDC059063]|uniref:hypothetical protein n=1 Tax=unclassified Streptomyces TaxID=2593676 RepID=UPI0036C3815A